MLDIAVSYMSYFELLRDTLEKVLVLIHLALLRLHHCSQFRKADCSLSARIRSARPRNSLHSAQHAQHIRAKMLRG